MNPALQDPPEPVVTIGEPVVVAGTGRLPVHAPALQVCPGPHTVPHRPQLLVSTSTFRHAPAQVICPSAHPPAAFVGDDEMLVVGTFMVPAAHIPLLQYCPEPHTFAQRPQLLESTSVFRHAPAQVVCPSAHAPTTTAAVGSGDAGGDDAAEELDFGGCRKVHPLTRIRQMTRQRTMPREA